MPITAIGVNALTHRCSHCNLMREIELAAIEVRVVEEGAISAEIVVSCEACQSEEHILGAAEDQPEHSQPGSYPHLHRLLADRACADAIDAQPSRFGAKCSRVRRRSNEELETWFPEGLVIRDDPFATRAAKQ